MIPTGYPGRSRTNGSCRPKNCHKSRGFAEDRNPMDRSAAGESGGEQEGNGLRSPRTRQEEVMTGRD